MKKIIKKIQEIFFGASELLNTLQQTPKKRRSKSTYVNAHETLNIGSKNEEEIKKLTLLAARTVKKYYKTPERLLEVMMRAGVEAYVLKNADKLLRPVGEETGFILPFKKSEALYLNFITGLFSGKKLRLSLDMRPILVLEKEPLNIYLLASCYYRFVMYRKQIEGADAYSRFLLKTNMNAKDHKTIQSLDMDDVIVLEEALSRDREAIDFAISLSKELSGTKNALDKVKSGEGANI